MWQWLLILWRFRKAPLVLADLAYLTEESVKAFPDGISAQEERLLGRRYANVIRRLAGRDAVGGDAVMDDAVDQLVAYREALKAIAEMPTHEGIAAARYVAQSALGGEYRG